MEKLRDSKFRTILTARAGELEALKELAQKDPWKPVCHIHPECGLLNDPNGLAYFNGEYHVFYQWYPFGVIHGMKHWAHVKSGDLVHWKRMPVAIIPTEDYESHGAYSGSALEKDGELLLFYTGNIRYADEARSANLCMARMDKNYGITKAVANPLIEGVPAGYTGHVRDPKIWQDEDGKYCIFLGAQRKNRTGTLLVYESQDALQWKLRGELKTPMINFGYMWECPDYFRLDGRDILLFCPQGLAPAGHDYQNLYNVIYAVGKLDLANLTFETECVRELDKGFDFYAPQTFQDPAGRRLLLGWAGMSETEYPSDKNQWAHCLTLPRQLRLQDGVLRQMPARECQVLRTDCFSLRGCLTGNSVSIANDGNLYELDIDFTDIQSRDIMIELFKSEEERLLLRFDQVNGVVSLDRRSFLNNFTAPVGPVRTALFMPAERLAVKIVVDQSIAEVFINDGTVVFTARVFPQVRSTGIEIRADGNLVFDLAKYKLKRGIL
ncbi:sucrose-6-phosphate hydrolase [Lucifera butyrica]|uniref:Sucrose-6-phosphate hydrolase n=1 Tax=Lucifera butyrica TaxID=1351585 RepID=A0A498RFU2_9FIRM|nr:sucrose-6-phosphate hydrolase [Lucifera butyrica]VBB09827.1 sucrose-6-phosphate hydrolase [Lucifera butyrica]